MTVKGRGFSVFLLTFLLLFPLCRSGAQGTEPRGRAESDAFLLRADAALAAGEVETARALVASALELSPIYSEALYARATSELPDRASTNAAIADLRAALSCGTWTRTDPVEAERALGTALLRTGRAAEARAYAENCSAAHPEDSRNLLLKARVEEALRDSAAERKTLADAAAQFPDVDELRLLSARLEQRLGHGTAAAEMLSVGLRFRPDSLPLLLASARLERTAAKRRSIVDQYAAKGGKDPEAALIGMEAAPAADKHGYLDAFLTAGGLSRQDLIDRVAAAVRGSDALKQALQSALSAYSGNRDLDSDGDGWWEERWSFEKGSVTRWVREPRQDGVAQYEAVFSEGKASSLTWQADSGQRVSVRYASYPFVETATTPTEILSLIPYSLRCPFLQTVAAAGFSGLAPRVAKRFSLPTLERLAASSYMHVEQTAEGKIARRTELSHGQPVYMEEDTNADGVIDHKVWYTAGQPVRGERMLPGSTVFNVKETWSGGRLVAETVDSDGDGRPDFRQVWGETPFKAWDYNEDGIDDSREFASGAETIRELSTRLDGVFDLVVTYRGDSIVRVTRSGTTLAATRDEARGVTWLGPVPASATVDPTLPEGVQTVGGRAFLVFHHGGVVYAEALQ